MHTRDAAHAVAAASETQERRKEACSCTGIFDKELEWLLGCARVRNGPAAAMNSEGTVRLFDGISRHLNVKAQQLETIHHRLCVLAPEGTTQDYRIARQRREYQGAIG